MNRIAFRILLRLGIIGIIALGAWVYSYFKNNYGECPDNQVNFWFTSSTKILDNFDYQSLQSTKNSYDQQFKLSYPQCLETLQQLSLTFFYNAWKAEEAYSNGDYQKAQYYSDEAIKTSNSLICIIRRKSASDSGANRPPVLAQIGQ